MEIKKSEMLKRAEAIEEECNHFLRTYVSDLSLDQATRRCAAIIAQFERLLLVGHEHCVHPLNVQVAVIPVDRLKMEVPEKMKGQLVVRIFVDTKEGFLMMVTGKEVVPGVAIGTMPPRKTSYEEILQNGVTPQELVQGVLEVLHNTAANELTNYYGEKARA